MLTENMKENNLENSQFFHLISSQTCEEFFRKIRSFTSTYSAITSCSVKEIIGRVDKIQLQNDITLNEKFVYPRIINISVQIFPELPAKEEIIDVIEGCKKNALNYAIKVGLISKNKARTYESECKIELCATRESLQKLYPLENQKIMKFYTKSSHQS